MESFNDWIQQFISAKGRGAYKKKGHNRNYTSFRHPFIIAKGSKQPLYIDSPEFNEWLEAKREAYAGLQYLKEKQ